MDGCSDRTGRRRGPGIVAILLASTVLASGAIGWAVADAALPPASLSNQEGFADLVAKVKPTVVNIAVTEQNLPAGNAQLSPLLPQLPSTPFGDMLRHFSEQRRMAPTHGLASGFIIDPSGYIVTNNHVIDHVSRITVTMDNGRSYPAKIIGRDAKTDLALLKIDVGKPLPYVAFGNSSKERVGDWVVAVGNPFGLGGTVTAGIVSAHDRDINGNPYDDFLQIDAPINPGNSGGPLFNMAGQVIGVDTAIYSPNGGSVGIGFAIPSNLASNVVAQLREHGRVERGWLGVAMQSLTPALATAIGRPNTEGVIIDQVESNSPAARADMRQGDIVTAFNGKPISDPRDLAVAVAAAAKGTTAKLTIWRAGQERAVDVVIGQAPGVRTAAAQREGSTTPLGMALAPLSSPLRDELGLGPSTKGVYVAAVKPGSRADESGVESGDVIMRIGNQAVTTPFQVSTAIRTAEGRNSAAIPLLVTRDGTTAYLALQLKTG
jgi:serine protease Do